MRSYGGATSQSFEQILAEKESEARHGSFQTRLTACDDQKSRMMYVMLKSKGGDRIGCAMGGGVAGFNWSHIVTSIIGYCISSWTHSDKAVIDAIQEAGHLAERRCLEGVQENLVCVDSKTNQFSLEFKLGIGITLISLSAGLGFLIWYWWCRSRILRSVPAERESDSSPDSLDDRRRLAHRQLAEIRSRGRRDVTAQ